MEITKKCYLFTIIPLLFLEEIDFLNANGINKELLIDLLIVFLEDISITFFVFVQIFRRNLIHLQSFYSLILNSISKRPTRPDGSLIHSNTIRYDKKIKHT